MTGRWTREQLETTLAHFDEREARVLRLIWEEAEGRRGDEQAEEMAPVSDGVGAILTRLGLPPIKRLEELTRPLGKSWPARNGVPVPFRSW